MQQILQKNEELKMAAELGRRMLAENDDLRLNYKELEQEHKEVVRVRLNNPQGMTPFLNAILMMNSENQNAHYFVTIKFQ